MRTPVPAGPDLARTRAWATVDLDAIEHNLRAIRDVIPRATALMAVVKADAYGHGAVAVARAAMAAGATWLGVATAEEALELRGAVQSGRILILGPVPEQWIEPLAAADCAFTIGDRTSAAIVQRAAGRPRVHIKIDTGMTRIGTAPEDLGDLLSDLNPARVAVEGVYTHFACADDSASPMTATQLAAFARAAESVRTRFPKAIRHAASSAAALAFPDAALDMVRIGIAMYGAPPMPRTPIPLRPAMTLGARVVRTRRVPAGTPVSYGATYRAKAETTIATVALGYGDGYPRALSGAGQMLVGGKPVPVAGRVCMDFTMLDAGDTPVREGDDVIAFGEGLPAAEVAEAGGSISYELFCRVGRRVPRVYTRGGRAVELARIP